MQDWFPHGWLHYLVGGLCIGLALSLAFLLGGLITGMSSFFSATWSWVSRLSFFQQDRFVASRAWRGTLAIGLIAGAALHTFTLGDGTLTTTIPPWQLAVGGLFVGFGTRLGGGCTSGHGICGLASLQLPSLIAVLTFLATAMATAHAVRALGGS